MLKKRLLLIAICVLTIWLLFQLPKVVIENDQRLSSSVGGDSIAANIQDHVQAPAELRSSIVELKKEFLGSTEKEKNAIFADSLANLYRIANQYDSAAWFSERASEFFNNTESWIKTADNYYQAYSLALDQNKQKEMAGKAQHFYGRVLAQEPDNLDAKNKMAMTFLTSANPMRGITLLREVLLKDPTNELALFNMGMLSIQSGQNDRAIERLGELIKVNPGHIQGQLLLGLAFMNSGDKLKARAQFEKVKEMNDDPAVLATVNSYLKELN